MPRTPKPAAPRRRQPAKSAPVQRFDMRGLSDQMPFGVYIPPDQVTAEVAIRVTAILACVRFLACSIASMPADVIRSMGHGRKKSATDLPCYEVLTRTPNAWQSQYEYTETTVYHCALYGNAYSRIVPDMGKGGKARGFCGSLEPLHPSRMSVRRMSDNTLGYKYLRPDGEWKEYTQDEIVHYRWISDNSYMGLVPSDLCGTSVSLARKLDVAAASFWDNSARPDAVLETQEAIPEAAVIELRRQWREMYGGSRRRGSTAILPKKVQVKTLDSNSMEASQFQELRDSIVTEVARCFGVPSTLIGDKNMNRWSTVEQEFLTAQVFCLLSWQRRIEGAVDRTILKTYGPDVSYKLDNRGLLRADTAGRTALYQTLAQWGAITPNEIRALEDLPLLEDPAADLTWIQQGFAPLNVAAQQLDQAEDAAEPAAQETQAEDQGEGEPADQVPDTTAMRAMVQNILGPQLVQPPVAEAAVGEPFDLGATPADGEDSEDAEDVSRIELDGDQLKALLYLLDRVGAGELSKAAAAAAINAAYPWITPEQIQAMVDGVSQPEEPLPPEAS